MASPSQRDTRSITSFGSLVRSRRRALDLTQANLATRVGCSTAMIKKIEHDERRPSATMAERLAEALEVEDRQRATFVATATGAIPPGSTVARHGRPSVAGGSPTFVGRETELSVLDRHLDAARRDGVRVVFVTGEAGQGKTALLRAFARRALTNVPELVVAQGLGTAVNGIGDPYLLFRDVLRELAGLLGDRTDGSVLHQERLAEFVPFVGAAMAKVAPGLTMALVPELADTQLAATVSPSRDQLMAEAEGLLAALAQQRPLVLILDDLHWSDPASMDLLFHLRQRLGPAPVLVVGAYRGSELDQGPSTGSETVRRLSISARADHDDAIIDLGAFDPAAARHFFDALIDREPNRLTEEVRTKLFWQTRGHPLFVLELLKELGDRGDLVRDDDGALVAANELDWEAMPGKVAALIEQRLTRLDERDLEFLEVAAIEGEQFTAEVVARIVGTDPLDVCNVLDRRLGDQQGLVAAAGTELVGGEPLSRYRFSHVLFQQYLAERISEGRRRHLHRRVGAALEELHARDTNVVVARLAHHFSVAGDVSTAIEWALRAGDRARTVYAHEEAILHYRRAVDLLRAGDDAERLARALIKLGLSHQIAFDHEAAQLAYDEAFGLWQGRVDLDGGRGQATLRLAWAEPPSMDPTLGGYNMTAPIVTQLLSGLVRWGEDNEVLPDVASSWTLEDDGRRMTFRLRPDATWHDGQPVTAHDFVATYRRAVEPSTKALVAPALLAPVVGVTAIRDGSDVDPSGFGVHAVDDHTLVIELTEPTSWFLHNLAYYVLLPTPSHVVAEHGDEWASPAHFVGNGPFRLESWDSGSSMTLVRHPHHHGRSTGNVGRVVLDLTLSGEEAAAAWERDELDVLTSFQTPTWEIDLLRRRHPTEYERLPAFIGLAIFPNLALAPTNDPRLRRALSLSLDRTAMARVRDGGLSTPADGGVVPAGMPGHVSFTRHADVAAARELAGAAGAAGGEPLLLALIPRALPLVEFLQRSWLEIGIDVTLDLIESPDHDVTRDHLLVGGWVADYPDPDTFLRVFVEPDRNSGWPQEVLDLLEQASRVTDQVRRLDLYERVERIIDEQTLVIPALYDDWHIMLKPWVSNFRAPAVKHPGFWQELQVGPAT